MKLQAVWARSACLVGLFASVAAASTGCASIQAANAQSVAVAAASAASAPVPGAAASAPAAARPDPAAPKPFDEVIKGATRQAGSLPLWRKDEKVWLELAPEAFDRPTLFTVNISQSVGERGLYASQMGPSWLVSFRKTGSSQVQLVALNPLYVAEGASMKATVAQAFSESLLGSATIASAAHKDSKAILVDAAFLLSDLPGYSTQLERAYRLPMAFDRGNSYFSKARATEDMTTLDARMHFATARLPAPPLTPAPVPTPPPSEIAPDPRSVFIGYVMSFVKPAATPLAARRTDPRLGHFFEVVTDLSNDLKPEPRQHFVKRWRLEKKDPAAPMSEPKEPVVFWIDKNVPQHYRKSVEAGVLEWNKAFEKIGFKDALVVRQQPDDADWDGMDGRHATIRWFVGADVGFAIGPSRADPRTGEIYDADIGMSDVFGRGQRRAIVEDIGAATGLPALISTTAQLAAWQRHGEAACTYAHEAAAEMDFALDVLEARGDLAPDGPEAEAFVQSVIKDVITHEVGHTLGLKHNFKGSTVVTREQLRDKNFTETRGISGSVMDYNAYNIPLKGERAASLNLNSIGPYDYWAIEYAYKEIAGDPKAELERIASRSTEPLLAYADDVDAGGIPGHEGIDPMANRFDLGDDPLAYYQKRLVLSRELWDRVQERRPQPGDDAVRQRRVLLSGFRQLGRASELVGKYVGGMNAVRDLPGRPGSRSTFTPVDPAKQREALKFLATGLFSADSFRFKPEFIASLSPDYNEWERGGLVSVPGAVLQVQSAALDRLMSPGTASRLLDLPLYVPEARRPGLISLPEVYTTLQDSVWSELKTGKDIDRLRRNLQREHLKRVQALLTRGSPLPPDALSLMRVNAVDLQQQLRGAAGNARLSPEARAHVKDSLASITEALKASIVRS